MKTFRQMVKILESPPSARQLAATLHIEAPLSLRKLLDVPLSKEFVLSPLSKGTVRFNGGTVQAKADGTWSFSGALHDSADWAGDKWAVGFVFANTTAGAVATGTLGAKWSGPARNATFNMSGKDHWITKNWGTIVNGAVTYRLDATDDPVQFLDSFGSSVKKGYRELKKEWDKINWGEERGDRPPNE